MIILIVLVWLAFQGLAICTLAGMLNMGFGPGNTVAIAFAVVTIGAMTTRAMYRYPYLIETTNSPHRTLGHLRASHA